MLPEINKFINDNIALIILIGLILYLLPQKIEKFTNSNVTNEEAIANISSMYNNSKLLATNAEITSLLTTADLNPTNWKGIIVAFNGTTPPTGWAFCDGKNGTPDLRDKFILGKGDKSKISDTGGEAEVTLTIDQMPSHTHDIPNISQFDRHCGDSSGCAGGSVVGISNATGGGKPHNNMPPYYVLAYIIKL